MPQSQVILNIVCKVCKVSVSKLLSPLRTGPIYEARMLAVRFLEANGETHETIGWILNRTRPSITYTSKAHKLEFEHNKLFRQQCDIIKSKIDEQAGKAQSV